MDSSNPALTDAPSEETLREALHQLQVHQAELEMQNEELRQTQCRLDAARSRYFDLYDLAPVGFCTVNTAGQVVEANLAVATLLGVTRIELVGKHLSQFIDRAFQDDFYRYRKQAFSAGKPLTCELKMQNRNGAEVWVNLMVTASLDDSGNPMQHIVLNNITESRRLDALLQAKNDELESARTQADKANQAKSDFLSGMSHELRTPLGAILGFAQLLSSGAQTPTATQQRSIDQILKAGWYLLELINEILELALIESRKLALSMEATALATVLHECRTMVEPTALQHGVEVIFPATDPLYLVRADRTRLKQVLINLLSNAIKYNRPDGRVSLSVTRAAGTPEQVRITVEDTGEGLSLSKLSQLFQPFNRLGQEASAEEGTGIGLVVCKRLVELMGGTIGVESTVGSGSVFWIELPLTEAVCVQEKAAGQPVMIHPAQPADAVQRTVLYVEDNPANLLLVQEIIARRPDLRLLSAIDGRSGIAMARANQPDVILMDIHLPGISGLQALHILADDPLTRHIPVLALSANAMPRDIEKGLAAGFFRYLTKPIKVDVLLNTLDLALAGPAAARDPAGETA